MSITVPYHLAIAVLIAVSIVLLLAHKRTYFYNHQKKVLWRYLLLLFSLYILIVGKNIFDDHWVYFFCFLCSIALFNMLFFEESKKVIPLFF